MDWRDIPSLPSLRAFEAAARTGTLSAAARELNVTHAAIAQHVRALEDHLGTSLLNRAGRQMALTPTGTALAAQLSDGFQTIIAGVRAVTEDADTKPLSLSTTPTFAENWLMPRLGTFWRAHPDIAISITPAMTLSDLRRDGFDLGIRYGYGDWPGVQSTFLVSADYVIVSTPEVIGTRKPKTIADICDMQWLFGEMHSETFKWAREQGLDFDACKIEMLATGSMLMSAVRAGAGVTIASRAIVAGDIAEGRLVPILEIERKGLGYYIITQSSVLSPRLKTFIKWLTTQA